MRKTNLCRWIFFLSLLLVTASVSAQQQQSFTLTKQGVGCLKMGMKYTQLPAKCAGLYTHFKKTLIEDDMNGNYTQYAFYNGTVKVMSSDAYEDVVKNITSYTSLVKASNGMYAGMPAIELYNRKATINTRDMICFQLGGYQFFTELSDTGYKKANDEYSVGKKFVIAPTDFAKGAKITSMTIWVE